MKYYSVKCPLCDYKTVGNWKGEMIMNYFDHAIDHVPDPLINESNVPTSKSKPEIRRKQRRAG